MPIKGPNKEGKYAIGDGEYIFNSKAKAERAYRGYLAHLAIVAKQEGKNPKRVIAQHLRKK